MLLESITLHNIRSYSQQTIIFPAGTALLSGDIGSGKSTILLAIEFALFGSSRPDLPAETLLRKGTTKGSVELSFLCQGIKVQILRKLKKDSRSIKQMPGHLIIGGVKKELMPSELKAEIIKLLGYPQELASKNKNYIFRFTVYTPQEEMKLILLEDNESRMNVLRKIFDIDKYKSIRENMQVYLKENRVHLAVLAKQLEGFEDLQKTLENHQENFKELFEQKALIQKKVDQCRETTQRNQLLFSQFEKQQKEFEKHEQEYKTNLLMQQEKTRNHTKLTKKIEQLQIEIKKCTVEGSSADVKDKITVLEHRQTQILQNQSSTKEKIQNLQNQITQTTQRIEELTLEKTNLEDKQKLYEELKPKIATEPRIVQETKEILEKIESNIGQTSKHKAIIGQSQEIQHKIATIDTCPTCLQDVRKEYKTKIHEQHQTKIDQTTKFLSQLHAQRKEIDVEKQRLDQESKILQETKNTFGILAVEISKLVPTTKNLEESKTTLKNLIIENNKIIKEQQSAPDGNLEEIKKDIATLRENVQALIQKEFLQKELVDSNNQKSTTEQEINTLFLRQQELEQVDIKPVQQELQHIKHELDASILKERELAVNLATASTKLQEQDRSIGKIQTDIQKLLLVQTRLTRTKETSHWIENHFIPLTHTIEKHLMVTIHNLFNQLFQEWFDILIDDDNIRAWINDRFTPVVEQNGHEVGFSSLSGGEKTSCSLAYRLALNRVINDVIHQITTKDLLILDEPTDGFSSEQLDKVRDVLDRLNLGQTILVSHETKIESFVDAVIRIEKNDHVSTVH